MINKPSDVLTIDELPQVILIFGEEDYLIEELSKKIINKHNIRNGGKYQIEEYDAEEKEINIASIIDSASAVSMLEGDKLVLIKNFHNLFKGRLDKKKNSRHPFLKYLENPNPSTKIILTAKENSIKGASKAIQSNKLDSIIKKAKFPYHILLEKASCIEFPKVWDNQLPAWIIQRFEKKGKRIDNEAARYLLEKSNPDLRSLDNEIDKIDIYFKDKNAIDVNDVNKVTGASRSYNIFELQKAIGNKDLYNSLLILKKMLNESRQEMLIISMLTRYFSLIWKLKELKIENLNKFQLAGKLGVSPMFIADYQNAEKKYNNKELNKVFIVLADTDEELKSSNVNNLLIMQKMIINIIGNTNEI